MLPSYVIVYGIAYAITDLEDELRELGITSSVPKYGVQFQLTRGFARKNRTLKLDTHVDIALKWIWRDPYWG